MGRLQEGVALDALIGGALFLAKDPSACRTGGEESVGMHAGRWTQAKGFGESTDRL